MSEEPLGIDLFRPYLLLLARTQLGDQLRGKLDPSDVVQQTLLEAHRQRAQYRGGTDAELACWLRQLLAGSLTDALRAFGRAKRDVRRELALENGVHETASRLEDWLAAEQSSPSQRASRKEELARLAEALAQLPEDQRRAIELKHLQGLSVVAIAEAMNRNETAVGGLLRRGLTGLRKILNKES